MGKFLRLALPGKRRYHEGSSGGSPPEKSQEVPMPPISLLIKPASGSCNMRCRYCFYADEGANRAVASLGRMTPETMRVIVDKALDWADEDCTFAFQGGEPTLAGLDFFRGLTDYVSVHPNPKGIRIHYALQTNGYALNEDWAQWFAQNQVLVGVSLDGPKEIHDRYRVDREGKGTFQRVMASIDEDALSNLPAVMENTNGTRVIVGPENVSEELKDTSVVMTKFDIGDGMQGMIGVVGPTRMDYAKVTARLSYFAESLSKLFAKPEQPQLPGSAEPEEHKE